MSMRPGEGYADDDRLPWLETVEEEYSEGSSILRILLLVLIGLAIVAACVFGFYWWQSQRSVVGTGELINAQEGDYKVKPDVAGGMQVQGQGDSTFTTSDGALTNGSVDLAKAPEEPVQGSRATPAPRATDGAGSAKVVTRVPDSGGALQVAPSRPQPKPSPAKPAPKPQAVAAPSGAGVVQLGAFPDEASANALWNRMSKRFSYLAPLGKSVARAEVNGKTVYRLRVTAGSASTAKDLCSRLKIAGESCFVAN